MTIDGGTIVNAMHRVLCSNHGYTRVRISRLMDWQEVVAAIRQASPTVVAGSTQALWQYESRRYIAYMVRDWLEVVGVSEEEYATTVQAMINNGIHESEVAAQRNATLQKYRRS